MVVEAATNLLRSWLRNRIPVGYLPPARNIRPSSKPSVCQVASSARQTEVARIEAISSSLLGRWQRHALPQAVLSSAKRAEASAALRTMAFNVRGCGGKRGAGDAGQSRPSTQIHARLLYHLRRAIREHSPSHRAAEHCGANGSDAQLVLLFFAFQPLKHSVMVFHSHFPFRQSARC